MRRALSIGFLIVYCCHLICADGPRVNTTSGEVEGEFIGTEPYFGAVFKGIQYGVAQRWEEATPPEPWEEVKDAKSNPPACPQATIPGGTCPSDDDTQSEDCLYLNVFTPVITYPPQPTLLPVLVFIHGGGFIAGYSACELYDGSYLATQSNIVVVTMNYRLGAFGFLLYGDSIEENLAIKDQRLALQWVKENIGYFGGDPNKVTLSGESAGAQSVAIHMTNEDSWELFNQAIMESDPFAIQYKTIEDERTHGENFAMALECEDLACLLNKNVEEILDQQDKDIMADLGGLIGEDELATWRFYTWTPAIGGTELPDQSLNLIENGDFHKIPTIMGTTAEEALVFVVPLAKVIEAQTGFSFNCIFYGVLVEGMFGEKNSPAANEKYPCVDTEDALPKLSEIVTDYAFHCPSILAEDSLTMENVPVYLYIFNYHLPRDIPPSFNISQCENLACHGAELPYVFHTLLEGATDEEKMFADTVSDYWANFVKTGNPNTPEVSCDLDTCTMPSVNWPFSRCDPEDFPDQYCALELAPQSIQQVVDYRMDFCEVVNDFGFPPNVFEAMRQAVVLFETSANAAHSIGDNMMLLLFFGFMLTFLY